MNPLKLLQFKEAWGRFKNNHPKFPNFLNAILNNGLEEGTVIEFHVTTADGKEFSSNIKLKEDDVAMFYELRDLLKN